jgi:hypothetical protein
MRTYAPTVIQEEKPKIDINDLIERLPFLMMRREWALTLQ